MTEEQTPNHNFSDNSETKEYVTSFAFGVTDDLLGQRLASPRRRLAAITIDLFCVGLLTLVNSLFFAVIVLSVAAKSLFSLRDQAGRLGLKIALVLTIIVSTVVILVDVVWPSFDGPDINVSIGAVEQVADTIKAKPLIYENDQLDDEFRLVISELKGADDELLCPPTFSCDQRFFNGLTEKLIEEGYNYNDANSIFSEVHNLLKENDRLDSDLGLLSLPKSIYETNLHSLARGKDDSVSVIAWLQGFVGDLGLSFGWAAVYFSVLTAWWGGQTVGKKLLGIRVVRIDGKRIDLWESIGRYGGYSAGLATGLLGFIQIYWDVNRQAIQDKISETLVIRLK